MAIASVASTRASARFSCAFQTAPGAYRRAEPRKTAEKALVTVIQEAWIGGVSTRRVDELVRAMGLSGISKSQISSCARTSTSGSTPSSTGRSRGEWVVPVA